MTSRWKLNYSTLDRRFGVGRLLKSTPLTVGGYSWMIQFFLNGHSFDYCSYYMRKASACVSLAGTPVAATAMPKAKYTLSLVGRDGQPSRLWRARSPIRTYGWPHPNSWGIKLHYRKPLLRLFGCLDGNRLKIRCELTVFVFTALSTTKDTSPAGADVTFHVAGAAFRAHKVMLAARSPVFDAELFGPMAKKDDFVEIADMEPAIFEMLLHFVYTDSLLAIFNGAGNNSTAVAADRYGMGCPPAAASPLDWRRISERRSW
ncbi:hypothetical protein HU200_030231 [Digitaria exilis]|uniref:BTB domain-containing protein n=1 Tax=Digitaria exilis TaxID=1010633 RepID=A0A835ERB7_9POAL|nr:hypothetical protein HU200_030231 [Digitaria exilis]